MGNGVNRRRQNNAPWWGRNIKSVITFLTILTIGTLGFFSYAAWLTYILVNAFKLWFKGLIQSGTPWQEPAKLGLTMNSLTNWSAIWPLNQRDNPLVIVGLLLGLVAVSVIWYRILYSYQTYSGFEKGAETFSSPDQLKKEYELIPDRNKSFPGYVGIPLVHYNRPVGSLIQSASYSPLFQKTKKK